MQLRRRCQPVEAAVSPMDHSARKRYFRLHERQPRRVAVGYHYHVSHDWSPRETRPLVETRCGEHREQAVGPSHTGRGAHVPLCHVQHGHAWPASALQAWLDGDVGARGQPHRCSERFNWTKIVSYVRATPCLLCVNAAISRAAACTKVIGLIWRLKASWLACIALRCLVNFFHSQFYAAR